MSYIPLKVDKFSITKHEFFFIDIEFVDTGVSQNVAKLGGKGQQWYFLDDRSSKARTDKQTSTDKPMNGIFLKVWSDTGIHFLRK